LNFFYWCQAFGFAVSYSTTAKTAGAVLVAFGAKIVLEELNIFTHFIPLECKEVTMVESCVSLGFIIR